MERLLLEDKRLFKKIDILGKCNPSKKLADKHETFKNNPIKIRRTGYFHVDDKHGCCDRSHKEVVKTFYCHYFFGCFSGKQSHPTTTIAKCQ